MGKTATALRVYNFRLLFKAKSRIEHDNEVYFYINDNVNVKHWRNSGIVLTYSYKSVTEGLQMHYS